jgi:predicted phosphate transport protein (TIGR00153 family)
MGRTRDAVFFDALADHAQRSLSASRLLVEMFDRIEDAPRLAKEISDLEHQGDKLTHDCLAALHKTWLTPLDREEIHALITSLDDVLDCIEAASERIVLFEIGSATSEARGLARKVVEACSAMSTAVTALKDLSDQKKVLDLCVEINEHENAADSVYRAALAALFKEGNDPLLVMKWRDIYDQLENATDRCEDVANIIEGVVLEHA